MAESDPGMSRGRRAALVTSLLLLTGAIYVLVPGYDLLVTWDDALYVLDRRVVQNWWDVGWRRRLLTPRLGYPVPIPTAIYAVATAWGESHLGPALHAVNLAVHMLNVGLGYLLVRRWTGEDWGAFGAMGFWAAHALLVESVASVTYLKTLLCGTAVMAAVLSWDRYLGTRDRRWALGTGAAVLVGLGCWPVAVMILPMLVVQVLLSPETSWRFDRSLIVPLSGVAVLCAIYVPVAFLGQRAVVTGVNVGPVYEIGWGGYFARIGAAFFMQVVHVVWPFDLHPGYYPSADQKAVFAVYGGIIAVAALVATVWMYRRSPVATAGAALFWLFYLPVSGIEILPRFTADAYMYIPLFGLSVLFGEAFTRLKAFEVRGVRAVAIGVGVATLVGLAAVAHVQTWRWRSAFALWGPVTRAYPAAKFPKYQLGHYFVDRGEYGKARRIYEAASKDLPAHKKPIELAGVYARFGEADRALDLAVEILSTDARPKSGSWKFLIQTCVMYELEIPRTEKHRSVVRQAAEKSLDSLRASESPATLMATGNYLATRGFGDLAESYLRAAVGKHGAVCEQVDGLVTDSELTEAASELCEGATASRRK